MGHESLDLVVAEMRAIRKVFGKKMGIIYPNSQLCCRELW